LNDKLLPCPFCRSDGLVSTLTNIYSTAYVVTCSGERDSGCCGLALNGYCENKQDAIDAWNNRCGVRYGFHVLPQLAENSARRHDHKIAFEEERYPTRRCLEKIFEEAHETKQALNDWSEAPTKKNAQSLMEEIEDTILSCYMLASKVWDDLNELRRGRRMEK